MTAGARITLSNPTSGNWDDFIKENAELSGARLHMEAVNRNLKMGKVGHRALIGVPPSPRMALPNAATGRHLVLCGAGPSLRQHWETYLGKDGVARMPKTDVWACNSALTWLLERDAYVTHGFGIDQTDGLLTEWHSAPQVKYMVASTVNPKTIRHLMAHHRPLIWFHNFVGSQTEGHLYRTIWPTSVMVGDGLNSVNRAMCLAQFMNYKKVTILGADCCLGENDEMHANGDGPEAHGATSVIMPSTELIDGRHWRTKPDMLFSAVAIAKLVGVSSRWVLVGDTFPAALLRDPRWKKPGWKEDLEKSVASLETMRGVPHPSGASGMMPHQPKGRNMVSKLFTVTPNTPHDDRVRA